MPSLKRTKRKAAASPRPPSPNNNDDVNSSPLSKNPSPSQVVSDLIDATCHEILSLQGDSGANSIPSFASLDVQAKRLQNYFDQLPDEPHLDINTQARLLLAKLALDVCIRSPYSSGEKDAPLPPLIEMTAEEWQEFSHELETVTEKLPSFDDLDCACVDRVRYEAQAMGALAKFRSDLQSAIAKIEEDLRKSPSKKKPPAHFSFISGHLDDYVATVEIIKRKLETFDDNLFLPSDILSMKRCSTIQRVKASAEALVASIEDRVTSKKFPLQFMQTYLWDLLKKFEKEYLPTPKLYQVGYFIGGSSAPSASSSRAKSSEATTPVSPSAASSASSRPRRKKTAEKPNHADDISGDSDEAPRKKKAVEGKKKSSDVFEFESDDDEEEVELEFKPSKKKKKKKQKRIPYTEEEKRALMEGVKLFGKGEWKKIRDEHADIFDVNNRSTVNLKDLYRTLTTGKHDQSSFYSYML